MSISNPEVLLASLLAQWVATAGSLWLTWWAAQSRDALALRVIAMVLVIAPAVLMPVLNYAIMVDRSSVTRMAVLFGLSAAVIAFARGIFLIVWAIVSKDRSYLRIGGAVIAALLILGIAIQALPSLLRL